MRRWTVCMLGLALVGGQAAVARAEPDSDTKPAAEPSGKVWVSPLFSFWKKTPEKTEPEGPPKEERHPAKTTAPPDTAAAERSAAAARRNAAVAQLKREEAAFVRRQEVCDKLRAIAIQTNDEELGRKIDQLETQAWSTYQRRTASLPGGNAGEGLDAAILDRHLGTTAGRADVPPAVGGRGVTSNGRAAAREEAP